jgi:hypothetical protein
LTYKYWDKNHKGKEILAEPEVPELVNTLLICLSSGHKFEKLKLIVEPSRIEVKRGQFLGLRYNHGLDWITQQG